MAGASDDLSQTVRLIHRAREGDGTAFEKLFARYSKFAVDCARRLSGDAIRRKEEAEDLAQSALVEVWRDFDRFKYRGIGSLDRYVRHVVENKIRDKAEYWHAQRRNVALERPMRTSADDPSETKRVDPPVDPLTTTRVVTRHETQDRIRRAIDRLPEEHALVLRLSDLEELPHEEVAKRLSLPSADAARMRVQRARDALRKILEGKKGG